MPISVQCTSCTKLMLVGDHVAGKRFRCPDCGYVLVASAQSLPASKSPAPPAPQDSASDRRTIRSPQTQHPISHKTRRPPDRQKPAPRDSGILDFDELDAISSYNYPAVQDPQESATRRSRNSKPASSASLRETNPRAFRNYDRIVNECVKFLIGISVLIATLASLIYFSDNAPSNPARAAMIFKVAVVIAGTLFVCGLSCLTRWRAVLVLVLVVCIGIGGPLLIYTMVQGIYLLAVFPLGILAVSARLSSALIAFPSQTD